MITPWTEAAQALREGRYDEALPVLLKASGGQVARLRPLVRVLCTAGLPSRAVALIRGLLAEGHAATAEALAADMLDAGIHEAAVYYLQASATAAMGRAETAIDLIRVGMAFDAEPARAQAELALILVSLGRHEEALLAFAEARAERGPLRWREGYGLALAMTGRQAEARRVFEGILAELPGHALAERALAALRPPGREELIRRLHARLRPRGSVLLNRLIEGPATEAELQQVLRDASHPAGLIRAVIAEVARALTFGHASLVVAHEGTYALAWSLLDLEGSA
ncbi:MAG: hypothetical protein VKO64_11215 [Candidatus Sericytochromatia bacterium]|nr:hypothetical protein [Candidatus Sericytochromatia bacterium]